jgi:hypothetical protein
MAQRSSSFVVAFVALGLALAGPAHADPATPPSNAPGASLAPPRPPPPKDPAKAEASGRLHFQRGQKLSADSDYTGAYYEFEAGYVATGRPLFLFNMAEAARASGDTQRARDNYAEFLRIEPTSALAATAKERIADIDGVTALPAPPPAPPPPLLPPSLPPEPINNAGTPLPPAPPPEDHESFVHRWPFWAAVAGVVVAGGVIIYATTRGTNNPSCGAGCTSIDFR